MDRFFEDRWVGIVGAMLGARLGARRDDGEVSVSIL